MADPRTTDPEGSGRNLRWQNERFDEFDIILAHDLRNPLNVAIGRLELARDECESDHLDAVARAHARMEAMIDGLLALARDGEPAEELEPVDLAAVARDCWRNVATDEATLVVETAGTIWADYGRLQRLFENLARNAIEHGGESVTITVGDLDDGFYVADDGPGIPPEERERAFEAGYSTTDGGTGLGLTIVAEIVDAHGWGITVTDDEGEARFEITGIERAA